MYIFKISLSSLLLMVSFPKWTYANSNVHPDCLKWFDRSRVKSGSKDCEIQCSMLDTTMGTFMCPNECNSLCKAGNEDDQIGMYIYYPGLTPAERKLVKKHPKDALTVFLQKTRAEWSSSRHFPDQGLNDESDAFRHFIWAGLLTKKLGQERAKEFLDAHEANPLQSKEERNMDLHNNDRGQSAARKLIEDKNWSIEKLEEMGLEELRNKQLKVTNPRLPIPKEPK